VPWLLSSCGTTQQVVEYNARYADVLALADGLFDDTLPE
jgi:hypothetical protein